MLTGPQSRYDPGHLQETFVLKARTDSTKPVAQGCCIHKAASGPSSTPKHQVMLLMRWASRHPMSVAEV